MPLRSRARKEKQPSSAAAAATTTTNTSGSASSHSSHELEMAERTARRERNGGPQIQEVDAEPAADERTHLTSPTAVSPSPSPYATPAPYSSTRPRSPEVRFSTTRTNSTYSTATTTSPTSTTAPLGPPYTRTRPRMPYSAMQQFGPPPIQTTNQNQVLPPGAAPPVSPTQRTSNVSNGSSYTTANSQAQGRAPPAPAPASPRAQQSQTQRGPPGPVSNTTRYSRASFDLDPDSDREREREFYGADDAESISGAARSTTAPGVRARRSTDVARGSLEGGDKEDGAPLNPPRPFFLAESRVRSSWSSQDSSIDPASSVGGAASDSERDSSGKENNGEGHYLDLLLNED